MIELNLPLEDVEYLLELLDEDSHLYSKLIEACWLQN